ncbi:MAG: hypothetical protein ACPG5P_07935, partial [Saprospiraceae bacterium]
MNLDKLSILDNYQLFELMNSNSFSKEELDLIEEEFLSRNIAQEEITRLELKWDVAHRSEV